MGGYNHRQNHYNVLTMGENTLKGDVEASAKGTVSIDPDDPGASRLDLSVRITPGPRNRERLMPVFSLLGARPGKDGSVSIGIRGTLGQPSFTM